MAELATLTWPEARQALERARLGIIAVGACEQHGPHLTLATDLEIACAFARRLAADLGDMAVLCPPMHYGLSEHHLEFPGTLTLRPATFISLFTDLAESLARWGVSRVLVVNGHGGNVDALRLAARAVRRDLGVIVGSIMWSRLAADVIASRVTSHSYGHACEVETSVAMALAPHCVHVDRIDEPGGRSRPDPLTDPPSARADLPVWLHEWTDDGALGDPRLASRQFGQDVTSVAYERAVEFARSLALQSPTPQGQSTINRPDSGDRKGERR